MKTVTHSLKTGLLPMTPLPPHGVFTLSGMCTLCTIVFWNAAAAAPAPVQLVPDACHSFVLDLHAESGFGGVGTFKTANQLLCLSRDVQPTDIHAVTAAGLLEKFLGPSHDHSQDDLVSADGTLKRADVSQRPNHTWHGPDTSNAMSDQRTSASKVSTAPIKRRNLRTHKFSCALSVTSELHPMTWASQLRRDMTLPFLARMHLCFPCIAGLCMQSFH